ncbi:MAG: hypothetical protein PWP65_1437 [Clostridia bacterium]|nr:hypothetical protein [Clostridia bacterium]
MDARAGAARISVISNTALVFGKLAVGISINSVSVISEAGHSGIDLVAAVIAYFSIRLASRPADVEHRYGHGKIENISGVIEALLIFMAAVWIIIEAAKKIISGAPVTATGAGILVMAFSGIINFFVSRHLYRVAKATDSIALEADALHLRTDVYTSLGVMLGLIALELTGLHWLDPVIALVVAATIVLAAYKLTREAFLPLIDARLPEAEEKTITSIIANYGSEYVEFHKLRTRKAGRERQVDLHLVVPGNRHVDEVHELCDRIVSDIKTALPHTQVLIHVEPCQSDEDCRICSNCYRQESDDRKSN